MHISQCRYETLHSRESPETSNLFMCSHAGTILLKEVSPASSEQTGREKRRKLHGTLEIWAGQGEQKSSPSASGERVWVLESPTQQWVWPWFWIICRAQGKDRACLGAAVQCPCWCSSSETLEGERGGGVPKAWLLWEKGCLCLFILLCFIIPSERKSVVIWKAFFYCGAKVAVVQAGWNHSLQKVAICTIALVQPYKIRPSNSSQSEDRKRETKLKYILL